MPILLIAPPGVGSPRRVPLQPGQFIIGQKDCQIVLRFPGIALRHAALRVSGDGQVTLLDLHSGEPTLLQGSPIDTAAFLPGQELRVGNVRFGLEAPPSLGAGQQAHAPQAPLPPVASPPPTPRAAPAPSLSTAAAPPPPAPRAAPAPSLSTAAAPPPPAPRAAPAPSLSRSPVPPPPIASAPSRIRVNRPEGQDETESTASIVRRMGTLPEFEAYVAPKKNRTGAFVALAAALILGVGVVYASRLTGSGGETALEAARNGGFYQKDIAASQAGGSTEGAVKVGAGSGASLDSIHVPSSGSSDSTSGGSGSASSGIGRAGGSSDVFAPTPDRISLGRTPPGTRNQELDFTNLATSSRAVRRPPVEPILGPGEARGLPSGSSVMYELNMDKEDSAPDSQSSGGGYVDMNKVEKALNRNNGSFRACYLKEQQVKPDLGGSMNFSINLGTDGHITSAKLEEGSTLTDEKVRSCIQQRLRALSLPAAEGKSVTFSYPLLFSPP